MINNFNLEKCPLCGTEIEATVKLTSPAYIKIECSKCHIRMQEELSSSPNEERVNHAIASMRLTGTYDNDTIELEDLFQQIIAVVDRWNRR